VRYHPEKKVLGELGIVDFNGSLFFVNGFGGFVYSVIEVKYITRPGSRFYILDLAIIFSKVLNICIEGF